MSSYSGLDAAARIKCRDRVVQAAALGLNHAASIHYTQGSRRWDGIRLHKNARLGQYPVYADCSAFVTWCLWNGLHLGFAMHDIVNEAAWAGGYTGTLMQHGKVVAHRGDVMRADVVLYGPAPSAEHTAIIVGKRDGVPMVVSHGSEAGPLYLPFDYRSDVNCIRRYI